MFSAFHKGFLCHQFQVQFSNLLSRSFPTLRLSQTFSTRKRNYYDTLGITPKASQQEIKAAYFKLSKLYHPDVAKDDADSAQRFRELTEAYEILSNVQLRKQLDSEGFHPGEKTAEDIFKEKSVRKKVYRGRSSIYNYDEWLKGHYTELFRKRDEVRTTQAEFERRLRHDKEATFIKVYRVIMSILILLIVFGFILAFDYATPVIITKKKKTENGV